MKTLDGFVSVFEQFDIIYNYPGEWYAQGKITTVIHLPQGD